MPIDTADLLTQAGYDSLDVIPLYVVNQTQFRSRGTTSTTFANQPAFLSTTLQPDQLTPDGQLQASLAVSAAPGNGEALSVRMINNTDSDPLTTTEITTSSSGLVSSNFGRYEPPTTDTPIRLFIQLKTQPGNNSSKVFDPTLVIGSNL